MQALITRIRAKPQRDSRRRGAARVARQVCGAARDGWVSDAARRYYFYS
jgi:hypothetical protein